MRNGLKPRLYGTAISIGLLALAAPGVMAQDQGQGQDSETLDGVVDSLDEVIVTGSRIKRSGMSAPSPVTVLDAESLALQGEINIANVLNQLPALGSTFTTASSTGFIGTAGLASLDLRRLGTSRTLVLVNGRRHVATNAGSAAVDINSIPQELVERVEVVTGGASAIYGADAVTGVVNFIMKDDFEGATFYAQMGQADEGDAFSYTARGIVGGNFANGKGNAVISAEWSETDGFFSNERSFQRRDLSFVDNPDDGDTPDNTNDGVPDEILIEGARLNFITAGGIFLNPLTGEQFKFENGNFAPFNRGDQIFAGGTAIGGDGIPLSDIGGSLQPDVQRAIVNANVTYKFNDNVNFFMETKYVNTQTFSESGTGAFDIFSISIQDDNAFLTDQARGFMQDNGISSFLVSRSHQEVLRSQSADRELFRGVVGFEGDLGMGMTYETSFNYGRSTSAIQQGNNRINQRFFAGIDAVIDPATGEAVCRSSIDPDAAEGFPDFATNGCVPINILGENAISEEAQQFAFANGFLNEEVEQKVANVILTGDLGEFGLELPGGGIEWAGGWEFRSEDAKSFPTAVDQLGLTFLNVIPPTTGDFDVWEAFAEVSLPILKDAPFAKELTLDGALRISDYSTVGNTTTWKAGLNWAPINDLRFRATFSQAVRAPNISELFGPQSQTFLFFEDPCDTENLDAGSDNREANCRALGVPEGFDQDDERGNTPGTSGGNPDLQEEKADTLTIGAVFQPSAIPGLSMSVDYWDIEIDDAINVPSLQNVLDNCVDGATIDNQFCPLIERGPNFQVVGFELTNQNFASLEATGVDFELGYAFDLEALGAPEWGSLNLRAIGTYVDENREFPFQVDPDFFDREVGELGTPEWNINFNATWNVDDWTLNYELRWIDKMLIVEQDDLAQDPDLQSIVRTDHTFFHDIQVRYQLTEEVQVMGGVNNLTQKFPPLGLSGAGTGSAIFDNVGRFFYGSVRLTF
ncbi:TonB-dependent receptor plug domain-containing protein [Yunchengibacter salinarum]|uniref:TonB-dependent receptor plug domain-containing protein n=1 Tax=Yunchengibacter salinarum TaxID=3133399 RepID=UPI0035B57B5A